jgi:hypothetical protein
VTCSHPPQATQVDGRLKAAPFRSGMEEDNPKLEILVQDQNQKPLKFVVSGLIVTP